MILLIGIIASIACSNISSQETEISASADLNEKQEGEILLKRKCQFCHHPTKGKIAPPMADVKAYYIKEGTTQVEFTADFINFILEPTKKKAKMSEAVANFGLMPKQSHSKEMLEKIADYIYNNELESPENSKK